MENRLIAATFQFDWSSIAEVNPSPQEITDSVAILQHYIDLFMMGALPIVEEEFRAFWKSEGETQMGFAHVDETLIVSMFSNDYDLTEYHITNIPDHIKFAILGVFITLRKQQPPKSASY